MKKIILILVSILALTSCRSLTYMHNKDLKKYDGNYGEEINNPLFDKYKVKGILLVSSVKFHLDRENGNSSFRLIVSCLKEKTNNYNLKINSVSVEKVKDINLVKREKKLDKIMEFESYSTNHDAMADDLIVFEKVNVSNKKLTKDSKMKITINVTVYNNEETITKEIEHFYTRKTTIYFPFAWIT